MANYISVCRSNYFAVKDRAAFEQFCAAYGVECMTQDTDVKTKAAPQADPLVGFLCDDAVGIPSTKFDKVQDDWVDADFFADLAAQLQPGWVAVVQEAGFEKCRYLVGVAVAINAKGETCRVEIADIYEKAKVLGTEPVTVCEY